MSTASVLSSWQEGDRSFIFVRRLDLKRLLKVFCGDLPQIPSGFLIEMGICGVWGNRWASPQKFHKFIPIPRRKLRKWIMEETDLVDSHTLLSVLTQRPDRASDKMSLSELYVSVHPLTFRLRLTPWQPQNVVWWASLHWSLASSNSGSFSNAREFLPRGHDIFASVDPPKLPTVHVLSRYNPPGMNDPSDGVFFKSYSSIFCAEKNALFTDSRKIAWHSVKGILT